MRPTETSKNSGDLEDDYDDNSNNRKVTASDKLKSDIKNGAGEELLFVGEPKMWHPLYSVAHWKDAKMEPWCTVVVLLPSGVGKDESKVKVERDGTILSVSIEWPNMMTSTELLHAAWRLKDPNALPDIHPKVIALNEEVKGLKESSGEKIVSVAKIALGMQVQEQIFDLKRIGDKSGSRILYVDLMGLRSNYHDVDGGDFVIT